MDNVDKIIRQFHSDATTHVEQSGCTVEDLEKLLAHSPDIFKTRFPYASDKGLLFQRTSYVHACARATHSNPEVLSFILEHGGQALINEPDGLGRTPLFLARAYARPEIAETLIAKGADASSEALKHTTALHFRCIRARGVEAASAIIDEHPDTLLLKNGLGYSPLDYMIEIQGGDSDRQELLVRSAHAGLLLHPAYGTWVPKDNPAYPVITQVADLRKQVEQSDCKSLYYGNFDVKSAVIAQRPERLLQKDAFGKTLLDYVISAQLKVGGNGVRESLVGLLTDCARGGLLIHPTKGVWLPRDKSIYRIILTHPEFLTNFFNPENWKGQENEALKLRDDMLHALPPLPNNSLDATNLAAFDFTPLEREAQARGNRGNAGDISKFLRRTSPSESGKRESGIG